MNILINHCWCRDSIWGGQYNCRVIVGIERIGKDKTYYDPPELDWVNLLDEHPFEYKDEVGFTEHDTRRLKPEVQKWLEENIKNKKGYSHEKSWAIGTDEYNSRSPLSFSLFFQSARDAMAFIKRWSSYKKPIDYLNYFQDIRRKLDLKTNRLRRVER